MVKYLHFVPSRDRLYAHTLFQTKNTYSCALLLTKFLALVFLLVSTFPL